MNLSSVDKNLLRDLLRPRIERRIDPTAPVYARAAARLEKEGLLVWKSAGFSGYELTGKGRAVALGY